LTLPSSPRSLSTGNDLGLPPLLYLTEALLGERTDVLGVAFE